MRYRDVPAPAPGVRQDVVRSRAQRGDTVGVHQVDPLTVDAQQYLGENPVDLSDLHRAGDHAVPTSTNRSSPTGS
jgi:hypothetical protein